MARKRKDRDISIVHFSFFDLLFGAFGAFVFLMIMQVLSTLNMVDVDVQKLVDETIQKKAALTKELEKYKDQDVLFQNLRQEYDEVAADREKTLAEKEVLLEKSGEMETKIDALERDVKTLEKIKKTAEKKGDVFAEIEKENKSLSASLSEARRKLSAIKTIPLKLKTTSIPTTITGQTINMALAAEGGSPPYKWELDGKLPSGVTFDKAGGTISGIVKSSGEYDFKIKVTDSRGLSVLSDKNIPFKTIKKYEEPKSKVSQWFLFAVVLLGIYLINSRWQKHKSKKYLEEMKRKGFDLQWVKGA